MSKIANIIIGVFLALMIVVVLSMLMVFGIKGDDGASSEPDSTAVTTTAETSSAAADESPSPQEETITTTATAETTTTTAAATTEPVKEYVTYTFRTQKQYDSHYEKHGAEFGDITKEEYLKKANDLINNDSDTILHKTEAEDGDYIFYDTVNNEILFLSTDGYIRTYFRPSQGIDYYNRQ